MAWSVIHLPRLLTNVRDAPSSTYSCRTAVVMYEYVQSWECLEWPGTKCLPGGSVSWGDRRHCR